MHLPYLNPGRRRKQFATSRRRTNLWIYVVHDIFLARKEDTFVASGLPIAMAAPLYVTQSGRLWHAGLILIVTVGLPGESSFTSLSAILTKQVYSSRENPHLSSSRAIPTMARCQDPSLLPRRLPSQDARRRQIRPARLLSDQKYVQYPPPISRSLTRPSYTI